MKPPRTSAAVPTPAEPGNAGPGGTHMDRHASQTEQPPGSQSFDAMARHEEEGLIARDEVERQQNFNPATPTEPMKAQAGNFAPPRVGLEGASATAVAGDLSGRPAAKGLLQAPFGEGVFAEAIQRETPVGSALVGQAVPGGFAPNAWGEGAWGEGPYGGQPADAAERIAVWRSARRAPVLSTGGAVEQLDLPLNLPPRVPGPDLSAWGGPQLEPPTPPPDLDNLKDDEAVDVIKEWFLSNFDDPAQETSRNDGEFQYIWGGPYYAREVIEQAFDGAASGEVIEAAVDAIEDTGIYDWAPHGTRVRADPDQLTLPLEPVNSNSSAPTPTIVETSSASLSFDGSAPAAGTAPSFAGPSAILPDITSIPVQERAASQFLLNAEGLVDLAPDPPLLDPTQREFFEEMRHKVLALAGLGHNQLAEMKSPVDRFLAALPEEIEQVSINRLWSRGNTLRLRLKAHEIAAASDEPSDPARLPPAVAGMLQDLVDTFNVFIVGDPKGRELDQVRLGPLERETAQAVLEAAAPIVASVQASVGLATAAAVEALTEQVDGASDAPATVDGDQAIAQARNTAGNFVLQVLRLAYNRVRRLLTAETAFGWREGRAGIYATGATEAIARRQEILAFVAENAAALKVFVEQAFHDPTLIHIIDLIAQALAAAS